MSGSESSERPPGEQTPRRFDPRSFSSAWSNLPAQPDFIAAPGPFQTRAIPQYQGQWSGYGSASLYPMGYPGQVHGYPRGYGAPDLLSLGGATGWIKPHRAVVLVVLAVCSFAICFVCGIIAFFMARTDLEEMRQGIMDPSGELMTKVAYRISLVHVSLMGFLLIFYSALFAVFAVTSP